MQKVPPAEKSRERGLSRKTIISHSRLACCTLCGALVPPEHLEEHLLGDEMILRIIKHNNPGWSPQECLDYYIRTYRPGSIAKA